MSLKIKDLGLGNTSSPDAKRIVNSDGRFVLKDIKTDFKLTKAYYYNEEGKMVLDYKLLNSIEPTKS